MIASEFLPSIGLALACATLFGGCSTCENMSSNYYDIVLPTSVRSGVWQEDERNRAHRALVEKDRIFLCQKTGCPSDVAG